MLSQIGSFGFQTTGTTNQSTAPCIKKVDNAGESRAAEERPSYLSCDNCDSIFENKKALCVQILSDHQENFVTEEIIKDGGKNEDKEDINSTGSSEEIDSEEEEVDISDHYTEKVWGTNKGTSKQSLRMIIGKSTESTSSN